MLRPGLGGLVWVFKLFKNHIYFTCKGLISDNDLISHQKKEVGPKCVIRNDKLENSKMIVEIT